MFSPIGGSGFRSAVGPTININIGGGAGLPMVGGAGAGLPMGFGDGFSPSAELGQGGMSPGFGLSPFSPPGVSALASQLANNPMPDYTKFLDTPHPGFSGGGVGLPAALLSEDPNSMGLLGDLGELGGVGDFSGLGDLSSLGGGLPPLGGDGSLTSQALMMQSAFSDANQASLIGAQSGALGGLSGAQSGALAGINPLMSGLYSNFG